MSYLSFLLRLWQAKQNDSLIWRASLENPLTGERRSFPDLESLLFYLEEKMNRPEQPKVLPAGGVNEEIEE